MAHHQSLVTEPRQAALVQQLSESAALAVLPAGESLARGPWVGGRARRCQREWTPW